MATTGYAPPGSGDPRWTTMTGAEPGSLQEKVIGWATSGGGEQQPPAHDGSITVTNPNGLTTVVYLDGTSASQVNGGPINHYGPKADGGYGATGVTDPTTGQALTPDQVEAINQKNASIRDPLGLGTNPVKAAANAFDAFGNQDAIANGTYKPPFNDAGPGSQQNGGNSQGGGGGDSSGGGGGGGAAQAAADFAAQLKAERDAATPRTAPTVTAGTPAVAGQVDTSAIPKAGPAATYTPGAITSTPSALSQTGPAGSMSAGSAAGGSVSAGQIDTKANQIDLDTDSRRQQQQAVDLAAGAARGTAPSAAQELMKESVDRGAAAQLGAAASLQGRNPGSALRAGLSGASDVFAKSAAFTGAQRADEMAQARRDFLGGTAQLRATDVDVQKANQSTVLQANLGNLSADTQAKIASLQSQTQAAVATLQAQTAAGQANLAAQTSVQLANLQAASQKAHDDASNELQAKIASGQISLESFKATLQANTTLTAAEIDAQVRALISNASNTTQTNIANTGFALDASKANASNALVARQVDDALAQGKGQLLIAALGLPADADKARILAAAAAHAGDQAFWGQLLVAGGIILAKSDYHAKQNISDGTTAADDFLASLRPKTFGYIDPADGPDYVLGVIAQDLPKRNTTRAPDGSLWIDANVISEVLAGLGRVNQRLKQVENPRG